MKLHSIYNNTEVTIRYAAARDSWGEPTTTSDVTLRARVERKTDVARGADGETLVYLYVVFLPLDTAISLEDRILIDNVETTPQMIEVATDFTSRFRKVYVK